MSCSRDRSSALTKGRSVDLRGAALLAFAAIATPGWAQEAGLLVPYLYFGQPCMKNAEFAFGPVHMDQPIAEVAALLGDPQELIPYEDVPDLDFPLDTWLYPGLHLYVMDDRVVEMTATHPEWQTPSGLAVRMTRAELVAAFGLVPAAPENLASPAPAFIVPFCNSFVADELGWEMHIFIDDAQIVEEISFIRGWP